MKIGLVGDETDALHRFSVAASLLARFFSQFSSYCLLFFLFIPQLSLAAPSGGLS